MRRDYLSVEQAAAVLDPTSPSPSPRSVHGLTCRNAIPLRRLPGLRRLIIPEGELRAWIDGAELEAITDADGVVRVVRPKGSV